MEEEAVLTSFYTIPSSLPYNNGGRRIGVDGGSGGRWAVEGTTVGSGVYGWCAVALRWTDTDGLWTSSFFSSLRPKFPNAIARHSDPH